MYFFLLPTPHPPPELVSSLRLSSDQTKSSPSKKKKEKKSFKQKGLKP